ncbi:hypothetical protein BDP27DRAFT_1433684 [Rhodocollybia butyracea]|uniref:F-box domain-containing protein n=1 Tax=Rhodocollybia butyracea TaxID=206335 RepID=A0A9P5P6Q7_9AGAR|nr:hypothetical protein BDP27DRAFT_1433684 [Rhodocollybia butyracea]
MISTATSRIPQEIWDAIFENCGYSEFLALQLCGKKFYDIVLPKLYAAVAFKSSTDFTHYASIWNNSIVLPLIKELAVGWDVDFNGPGAVPHDSSVGADLVLHVLSLDWVCLFKTLPLCQILTSMSLRHLHVPAGFAALLSNMSALNSLSLVRCSVYGDADFALYPLRLLHLELRHLHWNAESKDYCLAYNCALLRVLVIEWSPLVERAMGEYYIPSLVESLTLLSRLPRLDFLDGVGAEHLRSKFNLGIKQILCCCPRLLSFAIEGFVPAVARDFCLTLPCLTSLQAPLDFLLGLPHLFECLTCLTLTDDSLDLCMIDIRLPFFPKLISLTFNLRFWSAALFRYLPTRTPNLENLTVVWFDHWGSSDEVIEEFPPLLELYPYIRQLCFSQCHERGVHALGDDFLAVIGCATTLEEVRMGNKLWQRDA